MAGVELGARYRAGKDGAHIVLQDGSRVQLAPFGRIRFDAQPRQIKGTLFHVGGRGHLIYEAPEIRPER